MIQFKQKMTLLVVIGTVLEWAEFTYYAYIAGIISKLFFPSFDHRAALIATFSLFALGYFVRPIGALVFGYIGDVYGRKRALLLSVLMMGFATMGIGFLPTYHTLGVYAPLLLLLLRALQGFAVAGEFNGAAIFLIEHAKKYPYLAGSWVGWSGGFGMLLGSGVAALVALKGMPTWAWRVPFVLASLTCFFTWVLRKNIEETPEFISAKAQQLVKRPPLSELWQRQWVPFMIALSFAAITGVFLYTSNVYYMSYLIVTTHLPLYQNKLIITLGEGLVLVLYPLVALAADKWGGFRLMKLGFIFMIIAGFSLFVVPATHQFWLILAAQIPYALADALYSAPMFKILNDLLPVTTRYTGLSFSWSLSMAIFGGTAPMLAIYLQDYLHLQMAPAFYVAVAGVAGLGLIQLLVQRRDLSLKIQQEVA